ncbi:acyl carrier protein [Streptacidiphilus sp. EB129]|jgi:acyl carrier protein|uniref:acyl carrier protein n=1 Tax=Streptacidiphilus sp. EB129 TaxID=3156262 RepID=UPI0035110DD5
MSRSLDAAAAREWLTARIADCLGTEPERIAPDASLIGLGIDSIHAIALCGELEDRFGVLLEPSLVWDHRTVDAIVAHLGTQLAAATAGTR